MSRLLHLLGLVAGMLTQGIVQAPSGGADPVEGPAWRTVFESFSLSAYLDSAAVVSTGSGSHHVRIRWEHSTRQPRRWTGEEYDVAEVQEELDCERREHAPDRYRFFLQGSLVADEAVEPEEHRWWPFASGREQDLAYTHICSMLQRQEGQDFHRGTTSPVSRKRMSPGQSVQGGSPAHRPRPGSRTGT